MKQSKQNSGEAVSKLDHVFVYGTLKRGECREACWPRAAVNIEPAWIHGALIDLGHYPALLDGNERVLGELWSFDPQDIAIVFEQLDRIEGTNQPGMPNEYDRVCVTATSQTFGEVSASTYRYANLQQVAQFARLAVSRVIDGQAYVQWPDAVSL
ncbi:MAG: gamma-glutamylcyclotransferase [Planctomycetales bacterium]|nr:gamma-glutamylcyclotransferase [Planctomycetales bacterium]MCA9180464.1 gamma-glutamylcyclotransferase [Planctomycetales bacterium]